MHPDPQQRTSIVDDARTMSNILTFGFRSMSATVEPFLRTGFGSKYMGMQAAAGIPLIIVFSCFWQGYDIMPLFYFLGMYIAACFHARFGVWSAEARGDLVHSNYSGRPRLAALFKKADEAKLKGYYEPFCVFMIGSLIAAYYNPPLGIYLICTAFAMGVQVQMAVSYEKALAQQTVDAMIESRAHADRVRAMTHGRM